MNFENEIEELKKSSIEELKKSSEMLLPELKKIKEDPEAYFSDMNKISKEALIALLVESIGYIDQLKLGDQEDERDVFDRMYEMLYLFEEIVNEAIDTNEIFR